MIIQRSRLPVVFSGSIVDIETTGISPWSDRVVTVGLVHGNVCEVFQRTDESDMLEALSGRLETLPRPIFAFNKGFEESFLGLVVDYELQLRPYESLTEAIHISGICDPLGSGRQVPPEWRAYQIDRNKGHLERIVTHNRADLRHELCLAIVRISESSNGLVEI